MDIIPLIKIKNKKIIDLRIEDIIYSAGKIGESPLYIIDYDGIEKNKPNLCTYQKLSKHYDLWTDFAPKNIGDVVDSFMTGAKAIIVRERAYNFFNPKKIKDISDNKVFLFVDDEKDFSFYNEINGFITYNTREKIEHDFKYQSNVKNRRLNLYVYEKNKDNISYWKNNDISGILVDFDKYERFK